MSGEIDNPESQFDDIAFLYDELMDGVPYKGWVKYFHAILKRFNYRPASILDLCCGTGNISRILASEGYDVAGVDMSAEMIKNAIKNAESGGYNISYYVQNAVSFDIGRRFDLVVSFFDSLNYILDENDMKQCFKQVNKHLNENGLFIFDMNTRFALVAKLFDQSNRGSMSPVIYNWVSSFDDSTSICTIDMDFMYHNQIHKHITHHQKAYETSDIVDMLQSAGFEIMGVYDAYSFKELNSRSDRAFYIARKA